jgi:hypothetical protein
MCIRSVVMESLKTRISNMAIGSTLLKAVAVVPLLVVAGTRLVEVAPMMNFLWLAGAVEEPILMVAWGGEEVEPLWIGETTRSGTWKRMMT